MQKPQKKQNRQKKQQKKQQTTVHLTREAADKVAALIDQIYVQERNDNTDEQCKEAKEAWRML